MRIKVKNEELSDVSKQIINDKEDLEYLINFWIQKLESLKEVWQGDEADLFYNSALSYVKRMNSIASCYGALGDFINEVNGKYRTIDSELKDELEKSKMEGYGDLSYVQDNNY